MTIDTRSDSLSEIFSEIGNTRQFGNTILNLGGNVGPRWAYAQGGIVARIVDIPADMATARGVVVEHGTPELYAELDRLQVMSRLSDALRWSLLDGGGALLVLAKDGGSLEEPLDPGKLQQIEEFRVLSVVDMRGDNLNRYNDPALPNYGDPQFYLVTNRASVTGQYRVHESRLIPIPGAPTAPVAGLDMRDIPWNGRGVSGAAIRAIERYRRSLGLSEELLRRSQQAVHKQKGLAEMLMAGREDVVRKRIDLVDSNRSALNGVAIDSEDDYTVTSVGLNGVKDVLEQMQTAVAAETGYPVTLLFGRSPGGLNSTGEGDWALVYTYVEQVRAKRVDPALERIISLLYAQSAMKGPRPDDWSIEWPPLAPLTRAQEADVENKEADTVKKLTEAVQNATATGMLSEDEAHAYAQAEGLFGLEAEGDGSGGAGAKQYARETE